MTGRPFTRSTSATPTHSEDKDIEFTHRDGRTEKLSEYPGEEKYPEMFGEMRKGLLIQARDAGVFADLPTAETCNLGIEEHDGRLRLADVRRPRQAGHDAVEWR